MRKKVSIFAILVASVFIGLPVEGFGFSRTVRETAVTERSEAQIVIAQTRRRRGRRGGYWRNGRWYRNYGQYRRSVVGNRRYRMVPRYYWDGGIRRRRYVRVYY